MSKASDWEAARRPGIEAAKRMKVKIVGEELLIDCSELMQSEHDVRFWRIEPDDDGRWMHFPSGTESTPLTEMLQAIASCYTHEAEHLAANSTRLDAGEAQS